MERPNPKKFAEELSEEDRPGFYKMVGFSHALWKEADRGCVLLAASYVDEALESLLRAKFKKMSPVTDKELDVLLKNRPLPPLGSFSVRTRVASAMGLIHPKLAVALRKLSEIRNPFAHQTGPAELSDKIVSPIVDQLDEQMKRWVSSLSEGAARIQESRDSLIRAGVNVAQIDDSERPVSVISPIRTRFEVAVGCLFAQIMLAEEAINSDQKTSS